MITMPNNKLILNWHRIFNMNQLFEFFSKKFKREVNSEFDIEKILKNYENSNIAVRHADTFLKDEKWNMMVDAQWMKARSASTRQPMQRHITAAANYCSVLFSFLVSFIYLCKVTKNRGQNKRNSFLFYAEMQQLRH